MEETQGCEHKAANTIISPAELSNNPSGLERVEGGVTGV